MKVIAEALQARRASFLEKKNAQAAKVVSRTAETIRVSPGGSISIPGRVEPNTKSQFDSPIPMPTPGNANHRMQPVGDNIQPWEPSFWVIPEGTIQRRKALHERRAHRLRQDQARASFSQATKLVREKPRGVRFNPESGLAVGRMSSGESFRQRKAEWKPFARDEGRVDPQSVKRKSAVRSVRSGRVSTRSLALEIREKVVFLDTQSRGEKPKGFVVQARAHNPGRHKSRITKAHHQMKREGEGKGGRARDFGLEISGSFSLNQLEKYGR